ncbi:hypothetical protein EDD16DRAFT_1702720 [Pisolithus croceorrhizus]|nr:hypothetical protein EDD16DRAFT_1702720 [Pisolithus croceorrhizus]KAI6167675.1 hypothetical protein EDD17DRAFT_1751066 [Pisolithus thermaeus]
MATPSIPSLSRVMTAHDHLLTSGLYLGDSCIMDNLCWVHDSRTDVLSYVLSSTSPPSSTAHDLPPDCPVSPLSGAAELCAIVRIDREDFWLTADGGYMGPNTVWKEIVDVKLSCTACDSGIDPLSSDFMVVLDILCKLTKNCVMLGYSAGTSFFVSTKQGPSHFKLRHKLFETINATRVDSNEPDVGKSSSTDAFSFEMWPLTKESNHPELLSLKSTHRLLPVPAYDLNNDLICPLAYRHSLQGALVEIHFMLSHWGIAAVHHDVYSAEIWQIRLLVLPVPLSPIKKRRIPLHLEMDDGPSKKLMKI